jgi:Nucleotidyltransferase domain
MSQGPTGPVLPPGARSCVDHYLDLLSGALPDAVVGVYLAGSAALGDWRPERSDLDILTVTNGELGEADLDRLAELHAKIATRPYADAIYVASGQLGGTRAAGGTRATGRGGQPHAMNGQFSRDGYQFDPVLLATLDRHGITVTGRPAAELDVAPDPGWLREWNLGNLLTYWRPWAAAARTSLAALDPQEFEDAEVTTHAMLGPGRLHHTIATGSILSKTASADYTAGCFPGYRDLLDRAKAWRLGDDSVTFRHLDGRVACDLIDAVVQGATEL